MKTKTVTISEPKTLAESLYTVQEQMAFLKEQEDEIKEKLLESLKKQGVGFVRLDNGTSFTRSHRETLKVKDEAAATKWATENYCMKIDTGKAMKILRRDLKMPKFFTRVIGEDYLTVKRGKDEDDE